MPESRFKTAWNLIIIILLLYTATFVPYKTAFLDESSTGMIIFESLIDLIFISDIFVNFISAYEDKKVGIETRPKKIAASYLKSWFLLDFFACFPV